MNFKLMSSLCIRVYRLLSANTGVHSKELCESCWFNALLLIDNVLHEGYCKQGKKSSNERLEEREIIMMKSREVTWWYEGLESEFPENVSCLCLVFF